MCCEDCLLRDLSHWLQLVGLQQEGQISSSCVFEGEVGFALNESWVATQSPFGICEALTALVGNTLLLA